MCKFIYRALKNHGVRFKCIPDEAKILRSVCSPSELTGYFNPRVGEAVGVVVSKQIRVLGLLSIVFLCNLIPNPNAKMDNMIAC